MEEPSIKYAMAFVDGQNLYRHAKDAFGHIHPNYDLVKLHNAVCGERGWSPNLVRFYTGIPDHNESPMWSGYWSNRIIAMKREGISTTTRALRYHEEEIELPDGSSQILNVPQEKGIDIRLALDLVSLARKGQYDVAVIYSQDQDLAEVVQEVVEISKEKNRWIKVACAFPFGSNATTKRGIDGTDWIKMDRQFYDACLDPKDYRPRRN